MRNYKIVYLHTKTTFAPALLEYEACVENDEDQSFTGDVWFIPADAMIEGL